MRRERKKKNRDCKQIPRAIVTRIVRRNSDSSKAGNVEKEKRTIVYLLSLKKSRKTNINRPSARLSLSPLHIFLFRLQLSTLIKALECLPVKKREVQFSFLLTFEITERLRCIARRRLIESETRERENYC